MNLFTGSDLVLPAVVYESSDGMTGLIKQFHKMERHLQPFVDRKTLLEELHSLVDSSKGPGTPARRLLSTVRHRRRPWTKSDIFAERWKFLRGVNKHISVEYLGAWPMEKSFRRLCGVESRVLSELRRLRVVSEQAHRRQAVIARDIERCQAVKDCKSIQRTWCLVF